jgi:hypothetical protein
MSDEPEFKFEITEFNHDEFNRAAEARTSEKLVATMRKPKRRKEETETAKQQFGLLSVNSRQMVLKRLLTEVKHRNNPKRVLRLMSLDEASGYESLFELYATLASSEDELEQQLSMLLAPMVEEVRSLVLEPDQVNMLIATFEKKKLGKLERKVAISQYGKLSIAAKQIVIRSILDKITPATTAVTITRLFKVDQKFNYQNVTQAYNALAESAEDEDQQLVATIAHNMSHKLAVTLGYINLVDLSTERLVEHLITAISETISARRAKGHKAFLPVDYEPRPTENVPPRGFFPLEHVLEHILTYREDEIEDIYNAVAAILATGKYAFNMNDVHNLAETRELLAEFIEFAFMNREEVETWTPKANNNWDPEI